MEAGPEVLCIGMSVVDVLARGVADLRYDGTTNFVSSVGMWAGGDALNEAVVLAKLGHSVGLMTLVGEDAQGSFVLQECARHGVDTRATAKGARFQTTTTIVLIDTDGQRSFITPHGGTMEGYGIEHIDISQIRPGTRVLSIGSLFCSEQLDADAPAILKRAKEVGAITVADFVPNRTGARFSDLRDVLCLLDYMIPSIEEAVLYTGKTDLDAIAEECLGYGVKNVVIKMGGRGAYARNAAERLTVPVYPALVVVDTTGAGDNFVAGLISGLLRQQCLLDCLRFASATASVSLRAVGANAGVQSFQQVQDVIDSCR
jgi:sugar/nucleoside kinase (ribokinase family)